MIGLNTYGRKIVSFLLICIFVLCVSSCGGADSLDAVVSASAVPVSESEPFQPVEPAEPDSATISMMGDILIHQSVYESAKTGKNTYDLTPFFSTFTGVLKSDLNIANIENPIDTYRDNSRLSSYPCFNAPHEIIDAIKFIGINMCVTANNHCYDKGFGGLKATLANLHDAELETVGTYASAEEAQELVIKEIDGIKIGIAAFTRLTNGANIPGDKSFCVNYIPTNSEVVPTVLAYTDRLRDAGADIVIVSMHWGKEYSDAPSDAQRQLAHQLCEGGVDIIMGSHSHVVQPIERYSFERDGKQRSSLIIYSLGNFFANQVSRRPTTLEGMVVTVKAVRVDDGEVSVADCFYMPTYAYSSYKRGSSMMRLLPAGQYALAEEAPSVFTDANGFSECKDAWSRVRKVAGSDIPAVAGPDDYPDGFFD